jgi:hypothetical protein
MIVMREQLNVKQRQAIWETPAKGGGGGLVETRFSSLGRMVAFSSSPKYPLQLSQLGAVHRWTSSGVVSGYHELGKT